jgi:adenylosuccinate lyase
VVIRVGGGVMIERYTLPAMKELWSDHARMSRWLEVELLATEALAQLGVVPIDDAVTIRAKATFTVEAVDEREKVTDHDVAAFVDVVQESVGMPAGAWVHYGLTSSDVVDTALCVSMVAAADLIIDSTSRLIEVLKRRSLEFADTPCMGRTHGIHAEPTTFGAKMALWGLAVDRDRERMMRARAAVAVGKLSGAVGTYSNIEPEVETYVCERLGLTPVPATQVVARDRHAELLYACASIGATIESAPRCGRSANPSVPGRRAPRRCRTNEIRSRRNGWPGSPVCSARIFWLVWKTLRCGTSAISRTRRSRESFCRIRRP